METIERKTGKWLVETSGELHGEVESGLRAMCVAGEETDINYEIGATLTIVKGTKASLIVFYTEGTTTKYLEFIIDAINSVVKLDKVDGATRTTQVSVAYTIAAGKQYDCAVAAGSTIQCIINGATVISTTITGYTAGKHGFACDGTLATDYSLFNEVYFQKPEYYVHLATLIRNVKIVNYKDLVGKTGTLQDYCDYLLNMISEASTFIDGETERERGFFQKGGITITEYHDGAGSTPPSGLFEFTESEDAWKNKARRVFLSHRPVLEITEIAENKADIGESDDWESITKYRYYKHGEIVFALGSIPAEGVKNIRVLYKTGYTSTPVDIQMAAIRLITNSINKAIADRTGAFTSFARPTAINFAMPDVYTPEIRATLKRYRLLSYGEM